MRNYITIEREYGAGGAEIARRLAQELHIACYGEEILEKAAESLQVSVSRIRRYEEHICSSLLYSVVMLEKARTSDPDQMLRDGYWVIAEQRAIRSLADKGPAVFLGHCACEALKDYSGVLRVFVKAPIDVRKNRCIEEYGMNPLEAENIIHKNDTTRASYYAINTTARWKRDENYDVVLDSALLGIEGCVSELKKLAQCF